MHLVIITGMSGAGKSYALNVLEDMGYYCVDNLPPALIDEFVELLDSSANKNTSKIAFGIDIRGGEFFKEVDNAIAYLKTNDISVETLFLDADDDILISRYQESRRTHPLSRSGRVQDGIDRERDMLNDIKEHATYIIDTTNTSVWDLKRRVISLFSTTDSRVSAFPVNIISFGFKHGMPNDVDLVFDVRFLDNPYYIEELRHHTGLDDDVHSYVMANKNAQEFLKKTNRYDRFSAAFIRKGRKGQLSIAIGCTGGKHRSVTLASELAEHLENNKDYRVITDHINIDV